MDGETRQRVHAAIVRLADGDRSTFSAVFDELWPVMLAFVKRAVLHHADAEDLAQRTLLKVFSRIAEFDTDRDGVAWVFGIAAYEVKTFRRTQLRRREVVGADALASLPDAGRSQEDETIRRDLSSLLRRRWKGCPKVIA
jgi:RNA polymerase sigma-70 factor (ECF subfamily)